MQPFTIYAASHTYATMGKRRGVPTAVIQEGLGHPTESMSQTYLDSFEDKVVDDYDELIMGEYCRSQIIDVHIVNINLFQLRSSKLRSNSEI